MKSYQVGFLQHRVNLQGETKQELLNSLLRIHGGPQNLFDYILDHLYFLEDYSTEVDYENIQENVQIKDKIEDNNEGRSI